MSLRSQIPVILGRFNFRDVQRTMELLNWRWGGQSAPSIEELRAEADRQLHICVDIYEQRGCPATGMLVASGGFQAMIHRFEKSVPPELQLIFYVDSASQREGDQLCSCCEPAFVSTQAARWRISQRCCKKASAFSVAAMSARASSRKLRSPSKPELVARFRRGLLGDTCLTKSAGSISRAAPFSRSLMRCKSQSSTSAVGTSSSLACRSQKLRGTSWMESSTAIQRWSSSRVKPAMPSRLKR